MKAKRRKTKTVLVLLCIFSIWGLGSLLITNFFDSNGNLRNNNEGGLGTLSLSSPDFIQGTHLATTFLDEEAGISIYTDINQSLDLSVAKTVYKTIETETSEYIVGSISLPNLPESDDVHCFVHKDGYVVVYYLYGEPVSKIIDWNWYLTGELSKTKLQIGLEKMCLALGVTAANTSYYHFQYPYANRLMIIIDKQEGHGTDSFNLMLPSEFTFYERSWSHRAGDDTDTICGVLTAVQLSTDTSHTVEADVSTSLYGGSYLKIDDELISSIFGGLISEVAIALVYFEL